MIEIQLILLGIIQGITEFLPISSSAHLILISDLLEWKDQGINHDIAVHFGTLGAVIFYFKKEISLLFKDFFLLVRKNQSNQNYLVLKIIISTLPSIIVGIIVYRYFIEYFRNIELIAYSCIFFGILLYIADKYSNSQKNWNEITYLHAFIIGIFQILAFIPGASRAGVVITGSRFLGFNRESSAIYSMLLSIPVIFGSLILALPSFFIETSNVYKLNQIFFSTIISFTTAFFSIKIMIAFVKKSNYNIFVFYRILLGLIILFNIYI